MARNEMYEHYLNKHGVRWEYLEVPIGSISAEKSLRNGARLGQPLDDALVERYAQAYRDGDPVPPLIAYGKGKGPWVLADGNHRLEGARRAGLQTVEIYAL